MPSGLPLSHAEGLLTRGQNHFAKGRMVGIDGDGLLKRLFHAHLVRKPAWHPFSARRQDGLTARLALMMSGREHAPVAPSAEHDNGIELTVVLIKYARIRRMLVDTNPLPGGNPFLNRLHLYGGRNALRVDLCQRDDRAVAKLLAHTRVEAVEPRD